MELNKKAKCAGEFNLNKSLQIFSLLFYRGGLHKGRSVLVIYFVSSQTSVETVYCVKLDALSGCAGMRACHNVDISLKGKISGI